MKILRTRYTFSSFVVTLNLNGSRNFRPRSTHISLKTNVSRVLLVSFSSNCTLKLVGNARVLHRRALSGYVYKCRTTVTFEPTISRSISLPSTELSAPSTSRHCFSALAAAERVLCTRARCESRVEITKAPPSAPLLIWSPRLGFAVGFSSRSARRRRQRRENSTIGREGWEPVSPKGANERGRRKERERDRQREKPREGGTRYGGGR